MSPVVTTSDRVRPNLVERMHAVAAATGWPAVRRSGKTLRDLVADHELVYVVSRQYEQLVGEHERIHVHPGLLKSRLHTGTSHPLIRALSPTGAAKSVIDATLGLANDALHISAALECSVVGIEVAPPLVMLLESGLIRLSSEPDPLGAAAGRISLRAGHATEVLAQMPRDSADAVLLAPMYETPDRAMPGFSLLRAVAHHTPPDAALILEAIRVAPRLVVKLPRGAAEPPYLQIENRLKVLHGKRVDYWVYTRKPGDGGP